MEPSLPDDFDQMPTYAHHRSGSQNINASNGTQNNNTGAGNQNTGRGCQYIGRNYIDTRNQLSHLAFAEKAPFNSIDRQYEPTCHPDTRVDLVGTIYAWADGQDKRRIFWLSGLAGTGKSTIARTVAREHSDKKRLGASFFFSRGGGDVSHARKFVTTIAVQLADNVPSLKPHICHTIANQSNIASLSLQDQWRQLIQSPLSKLEGNLYQPYTLVIDALDECENGNEVQIILTLLLEAASSETYRLRILLTSRPEIAIQRGLPQTPEAKHCNFVLHNISPPLVDHDIEVFLRDKLEKIGKESWLDSWPEDKAIKIMVQRASGLFVWAATACRFISEGKRYAPRRLDTILEGSSSAATAPEKHLDEMYITVLKQSTPSTYTDEEKEESFATLRHVLGSIVVLLSPLAAHSLSRLLDFPKGKIDQSLESLHAILVVPEDQTHPLRLHHPSFRDFLLSAQRCCDPRFQVEQKDAHKVLTNHCIQLMSQKLRKKNLYGLRDPGPIGSQIPFEELARCLPPELQYACEYWVSHLQRSEVKIDNKQYLDDDGLIHVFIQQYFLYWLEALSLAGKLSEGIHAIRTLEDIVDASQSPRLYNFIYDAKRFVLYNRSIIEKAPLQLYCSALLFAPENSIIRRQFEEYIPPWILMKPKVQADWSNALQALEGHSEWVRSVAFSPDGKQVVSGSGDGTVRLWDSVTGATLQTLQGHSAPVISVAFSPDGKQVVSGSGDGTVRLWDSVTGAALQTLEGYSARVNSVAFSPDGKQVVSGSVDGTVRLWDSVTGAALQTHQGHSDWVSSVAFSPDGKQVVSGSRDGTVRLWDSVTGAALQTLEGHSDWVTSVAFSPDGKQVVSGSGDGTVRLWDSVTGAALQTLEGHSECVTSVAFSPDGKQVVSGSGDGTVRLWDSVTGAALQTHQGHSDWVTSVAFSPDGKQVVSGSDDGTVRLWDSVTGAALQTLEGHSKWVSSVAFSPDGKQVVSGSGDGTVRLWDSVTGAALQTLEGHSGWVSSVAFSPDGKQVVSGSEDRTVRLWDSVTGATLQTLEGHSGWGRSVAFSPDGKQVVAWSVDGTVRLWDRVTGAGLQTRTKVILIGSPQWPSHRMASKSCRGHMIERYGFGIA
ncbi:hypothetical protein N7G274_006667 [Stereocaulon virgatum]|uniref:Nephrocystin 3-like N-terminal domain-containing protein n=1 Tax=Stereocaulon virgatum TaxID=373712 RepID=A0ABR4ABH5_9LECA